MQPAAVIADSFECGRYDSVRTYCHSHMAVAMTIKLSPISFIVWNSPKTVSDTVYRMKFYHKKMTLKMHLHTISLLFFPYFNVFGRVHNRSSEIIVCCRVLTCDSGSESESARSYRLQLRLRLQPKLSTPTDSRSGLDSDSATLVSCILFQNSLQPHTYAEI